MKTTSYQPAEVPSTMSGIPVCNHIRASIIVMALMFTHAALADYWPRPFESVNFNGSIYAGSTSYGTSSFSGGTGGPVDPYRSITISPDGVVTYTYEEYLWDETNSTYYSQTVTTQLGTYQRFQFSDSGLQPTDSSGNYKAFTIDPTFLDTYPLKDGFLVSGKRWTPFARDSSVGICYFADAATPGYLAVSDSTDGGNSYYVEYTLDGSISTSTATYDFINGVFSTLVTILPTDSEGNVAYIGSPTDVHPALPNQIWINGSIFTFYRNSSVSAPSTAYYWSNQATQLLTIDTSLNMYGILNGWAVSGTFPSDPANYPTFLVNLGGQQVPANSGGPLTPLTSPSFGGPPGLKVNGVMWTLYASIAVDQASGYGYDFYYNPSQTEFIGVSAGYGNAYWYRVGYPPVSLTYYSGNGLFQYPSRQSYLDHSKALIIATDSYGNPYNPDTPNFTASPPYGSILVNGEVWQHASSSSTRNGPYDLYDENGNYAGQYYTNSESHGYYGPAVGQYGSLASEYNEYTGETYGRSFYLSEPIGSGSYTYGQWGQGQSAFDYPLNGANTLDIRSGNSDGASPESWTAAQYQIPPRIRARNVTYHYWRPLGATQLWKSESGNHFAVLYGSYFYSGQLTFTQFPADYAQVNYGVLQGATTNIELLTESGQIWTPRTPSTGRPATVVVDGKVYRISFQGGGGTDVYLGPTSGQSVTISPTGTVTIQDPNPARNATGTFSGGQFTFTGRAPITLAGNLNGQPTGPNPYETVQNFLGNVDIFGNVLSMGSLANDSGLAGATFHFGDNVDTLTASLSSTLAREKATWLWARKSGGSVANAMRLRSDPTSTALSLFNNSGVESLILTTDTNGTSTISSKLLVTRDVSFTGKLDLTGNLSVAGALTGELNVTGNLKKNNSPFLTQAAADLRYLQTGGTSPIVINNGSTTISGPLTLSGTTGNLTTSGNATITGAATVGALTASSITTAGNATVDGLTANASATFEDNVVAKASLVVQGIHQGPVNDRKVVAKPGQEVLIPEQGDISMGEFRYGTLPVSP